MKRASNMSAARPSGNSQGEGGSQSASTGLRLLRKTGKMALRPVHKGAENVQRNERSSTFSRCQAGSLNATHALLEEGVLNEVGQTLERRISFWEEEENKPSSKKADKKRSSRQNAGRRYKPLRQELRSAPDRRGSCMKFEGGKGGQSVPFDRNL